MNDIKVPKRIENSIINALQGGVVPRVGLGYIAVGREQEIKALLKDIEIIQEGGSTFRFLTGDYGSGKTFLLQTIKDGKRICCSRCRFIPRKKFGWNG